MKEWVKEIGIFVTMNEQKKHIKAVKERQFGFCFRHLKKVHTYEQKA